MSGEPAIVAQRRDAPIVVLCHVALDERNGGGLRTLLLYLAQLEGRSFVSVHFGDTPDTGRHGLRAVTYRLLERKSFPTSVTEYARALRGVKREFGDDAFFLLFPNTKDDLQLCFAATLLSRRTCVWLMDDFIRTVFPGHPFRRRLLERLFALTYRRAGSRIAISTPMRREYGRRYGRDAKLVLGKRWCRAEVRAAPRRQTPVSGAAPLRLVWIGKYQPYYHEPVLALSGLLRADPRIPVRLDLYGQVRPPPEVLVPDRVAYRGSFEDKDLLETLRKYDFGLLTYSFDPHTRAFMRYSFPGKLTDYVSAGLPVLTISPRDISVCDDLVRRDVGPHVYSLDADAVGAGLAQAFGAGPETLEKWRHNSLAWAREEFVFEDGLAQFKQLFQ